MANYKGELYNLPFNMNTFHQMWGVNSPAEAMRIIEEQRYKGEICSLEQQALALVGKDIYEKLIKGYTEKQWGRSCSALPTFIIRRLPLRFSYDNNYFNNLYQGVPVGGYNKLIEGMLAEIECWTDTDFFDGLNTTWRDIADKLVYTGKIDDFYGHRFGQLQYRSLRFESEVLYTPNYHGVAQMNYTDVDTPFTRIIEHKHFECFGNDIYSSDQTVITREYPQEYISGNEAYYPINDIFNNAIYSRYFELTKSETDVLFGGRLAEYKYYDMDKIVENAFSISQIP